MLAHPCLVPHISKLHSNLTLDNDSEEDVHTTSPPSQDFSILRGTSCAGWKKLARGGGERPKADPPMLRSGEARG